MAEATIWMPADLSAAEAARSWFPKGNRTLVTIPSWQLDVEREIDVIEEIARLHGYDKFESTLRPTAVR